MTEIEQFAKDVRKKVIDNGITMNELAEKVGVSKTYLFYILSGKRKAKPVREKIKKELNM